MRITVWTTCCEHKGLKVNKIIGIVVIFVKAGALRCRNINFLVVVGSLLLSLDILALTFQVERYLVG